MSQNTIKVCPTCGQSNKTDKLTCAFCGASLETATVIPAFGQLPQVGDIVPVTPPTGAPTGASSGASTEAPTEAQAESPSGTSAEASAEASAEMPADSGKVCLALFVPGSREPIKIRLNDDESIILGRMVEGETENLADLGPYNAQWLGVSRHHSMISRAKDQYLLKDIGSTNGTWINDQRLNQLVPHAINNGDQLRLSQLILFAYFLTDEKLPEESSTAAASQTAGLPEAAPTVEVPLGTDTARGLILLVEKDPSADATPKLPALTPEYLSTVIGAYLSAIADAQVVVDQALGRTESDIGLVKFSMRARQHTIRVGLTGVDELLLFLRDQVRSWRRTHAETIEKLRSEQEKASGEAGVDEAIRQQMQEAKTALAADFIRQTAPTLSTDDRSVYQEKLLPYLDHLAAGALEMSLDRRE